MYLNFIVMCPYHNQNSEILQKDVSVEKINTEFCKHVLGALTSTGQMFVLLMSFGMHIDAIRLHFMSIFGIFEKAKHTIFA